MPPTRPRARFGSNLAQLRETQSSQWHEQSSLTEHSLPSVTANGCDNHLGLYRRNSGPGRRPQCAKIQMLVVSNMAYAAQHVCSAHTYFVPHHTKEFGEFGVPLPHPPAFRPIRRNNSKKADSITCLYLRACWGASATKLAVQCPEAVQCPPAPLARRLCYRVRWRVLAAPPSSLVANGGWPPRLSRCIECCRSCTLQAPTHGTLRHPCSRRRAQRVKSLWH